MKGISDVKYSRTDMNIFAVSTDSGLLSLWDERLSTKKPFQKMIIFDEITSIDFNGINGDRLAVGSGMGEVGV